MTKGSQTRREERRDTKKSSWLSIKSSDLLWSLHRGLRKHLSGLGNSRVLWIPYSVLVFFAVSYWVLLIVVTAAKINLSDQDSIALWVGLILLWPVICLFIAFVKKDKYGSSYGLRYLWWLTSFGRGWFMVTAKVLGRLFTVFMALGLLTLVGLFLTYGPLIIDLLFFPGHLWGNQYGGGMMGASELGAVGFVFLVALLVGLTAIMGVATLYGGIPAVIPVGTIVAFSANHAMGLGWAWPILSYPDQQLADLLSSTSFRIIGEALTAGYPISIAGFTLILVFPAYILDQWTTKGTYHINLELCENSQRRLFTRDPTAANLTTDYAVEEARRVVRASTELCTWTGYGECPLGRHYDRKQDCIRDNSSVRRMKKLMKAVPSDLTQPEAPPLSWDDIRRRY